MENNDTIEKIFSKNCGFYLSVEAWQGGEKGFATMTEALAELTAWRELGSKEKGE